MLSLRLLPPLLTAGCLVLRASCSSKFSGTYAELCSSSNGEDDGDDGSGFAHHQVEALLAAGFGKTQEVLRQAFAAAGEERPETRRVGASPAPRDSSSEDARRHVLLQRFWANASLEVGGGPATLDSLMPRSILDWIATKPAGEASVSRAPVKGLGGKGLTKADVEKGTQILNAQLLAAQVQLDQKLISCGTYKQSRAEEIADLEQHMTFLSGEIGIQSADALKASQEVKQLDTYIKQLREQVEANQLRCKRQDAEAAAKIRFLQGDEQTMISMRSILNCATPKKAAGAGAGAAAFLLQQTPAAPAAVFAARGVEQNRTAETSSSGGLVVAEAEREAVGFLAECPDGQGEEEEKPAGLDAAAGNGTRHGRHGAPSSELFLFEAGRGAQTRGLAFSALSSGLSNPELRKALQRTLTKALLHPEEAARHQLSLLADSSFSAREAADGEFEFDARGCDAARGTPCRPCVMRRFRCAETEDGLGELAGQVSDTLFELQVETTRHEAECEEREAELNQDIRESVTLQGTASERMQEASTAQGPLRAEMGLKAQEKRELQREFEKGWADCKDSMHELAFDKVCGLRKTRDGLRMAFGITETPRDCVVSEWVAGECSVTCGLNKGTRLLERRVLYPPKLAGAACPPLQLATPCGDTNCPQDCKLGAWSSWGKCTTECNGGAQTRTRSVLVEARNGGVPCASTSNSRTCGLDPCDRDCELAEWSLWSKCTRACGGGRRARRRRVKKPTRGMGSCPHAEARLRLETQQCNAGIPCPADPVCGTPLDLVLLVDASGSISQQQFEATKQLVAALATKFRLGSKDQGKEAGSKVGVVSFSDQGEIVVPPTEDEKELQAKISENLRWLGGFTQIGAGLVRAKDALMIGGRKRAQSTVLVLTDGKLSYKFRAKKVVQDLRDQSTRVVFVPVQKMFKDFEGLQSFVSDPAGENILPVDGAEYLAAHVEAEARSLMLNICPIPVNRAAPTKKKSLRRAKR